MYVITCMSKTLQLFTKSTGSTSEWFLSPIYVSLVGLFPTVGHTKNAVIPTPGLFIERKYAVLVSFNNLCRKYREPDLHCHQQKKRYTHTFLKKNNRPYCFTRPEILRTHWHTHKREQWKVSFNLPTLTIPPALGPEALDFSCRLPRVADKKEQVF